MFQKVTELTNLKELIRQEELVMIYFSQPSCSVCHGLKPQVEKRLVKYTEKIKFLEVNVLDIPEVAGEYQIMTIPVILLFYRGSEYMRKARIIPLDDLEKSVQKIVEGATGVLE
ncbi:hypothetical protein CBF34_07540 [Vagococcus penaei]|uniref:Thioredoxin domain-containing protein n=1 Tax=Vagococcus penaei TaxID=633807 RepID=A0A1Q2D393_9ENTE|nr:thioredoxin family protein [Vagococcus penaei]AQP52830.1 hypothetical protein BW732_00405 [Vagococcus penaei]RSU01171.1 hypothetical protein CBF34_07540 [Vagococcus penaei]